MNAQYLPRQTILPSKWRGRSGVGSADEDFRRVQSTAEPASIGIASTAHGTTERPQGLGEEIANSVVHGVALLAAIAAVPFLVAPPGPLGTAELVGRSVFAASMLLLYLTSTLFHALPEGRAKRVFLKLDHCAIYVFIAGSYTPFALGALNGPWGWTLFGLIWSLAAFGVAMKVFDRLSQPFLSVGLYLVMGWLVLVAAAPLVEHVPLPGIQLLVAGGLAYTLGIVFFALSSRLRYAHTIWHAFVVTGSVCHVLAVLGYAG
jgi:hemolysin III